MPLDAESKLKLEEFEAKFLGGRESVRTRQLGESAAALARLILENCPASGERTTALAYLDNALLFAHAAITRHPE